MKNFFEEYGMTMLITFVFIVIIFFTIPLAQKYEQKIDEYNYKTMNNIGISDNSIKKNKIEYVLDGGEFTTEPPYEFAVSDGVTFINPIKNGCTFDGWHLSYLLGDNPVTNISPGIRGDVKLYAKWKNCH